MPSLKYIKIKSKAQVPDHLDPPNYILRLGCIQAIWGPYWRDVPLIFFLSESKCRFCYI